MWLTWCVITYTFVMCQWKTLEVYVGCRARFARRRFVHWCTRSSWYCVELLQGNREKNNVRYPRYLHAFREHRDRWSQSEGVGSGLTPNACSPYTFSSRSLRGLAHKFQTHPPAPHRYIDTSMESTNYPLTRLWVFVLRILLCFGDDNTTNEVFLFTGQYVSLPTPVSYTHLTLPTIYSV